MISWYSHCCECVNAKQEPEVASCHCYRLVQRFDRLVGLGVLEICIDRDQKCLGYPDARDAGEGGRKQDNDELVDILELIAGKGRVRGGELIKGRNSL